MHFLHPIVVDAFLVQEPQNEKAINKCCLSIYGIIVEHQSLLNNLHVIEDMQKNSEFPADSCCLFS